MHGIKGLKPLISKKLILIDEKVIKTDKRKMKEEYKYVKIC